MSNLVPVCFDLYAAVIWLEVSLYSRNKFIDRYIQGYIQGDYYKHPKVMPEWVNMFHETAHFLAIVPPALYSYIFCGPEQLLSFCKV